MPGQSSFSIVSLVLGLLCLSPISLSQAPSEAPPTKCLEPIGIFSTEPPLNYDAKHMNRIVAVPCEGGNVLFLLGYVAGESLPSLTINAGGIGIASAIMSGSVYVFEVPRGSTATFYVIEFDRTGPSLRNRFTTRDKPHITVSKDILEITADLPTNAIDTRSRSVRFTYKTR